MALLAVFAAGLFSVGALGRQSDSPLIVVDQSIGGVAIGMSQSEVEALYGAPDETLEITVRGGGTGLLVHYHVNGGDLIVTYVDGKVVSVETTSTYYRTSSGIGPGTSKAGLRGFHEDFCSLGLWDGNSSTPPDGVVTVFQTSGDVIQDVTITELGYYDLCESVPTDQEVPEPGPPPSSTVELTVQIDPPGGGWVRSDPYEIDCPNACIRLFDRGTTVTLMAHPTSGFTFEGWSGACTGVDACVVTLAGATSVTAHFSGYYVPVTTTTTRTRTSRTSTAATTSTTFTSVTTIDGVG